MSTANYDSSRLTQMRRNRTIANYANSIDTQINSAANSAFTVRRVQQPNETNTVVIYKNEAPCGCAETYVRRSVGQICCGAATQ